MAEAGATAEPRPGATPSGVPRPHVAALPLAAAVAVLAFAASPFGARAFLAAILAGTLVVLSAIDIQRGVVPNRIVLPAIGIVLSLRIAFYPAHAGEWIAAGLIAGAVFLLPRLLDPNAIGMGDVKLAALIGFALGWGVALAVPAAFLCAFPAAVLVVARGGLAARKSTLPFAPFLSLGALIVVFAPYLAGLPTAG